MNIPLKSSLLAAALAVASFSPSAAEEWKRRTAYGGELTREVTREGRLYHGETTRVGPGGSTYSSSATCFDGVVDRCRRSFSATGPAGKTVSGQRYGARGPFRVGTVGSVTGPAGNTVVGIRRHWR